MTSHKKPANTNTTGIFKLAVHDLPALRQAVKELGQAFFTVDLHQAQNVPGFINAFKKEMNFPEWFGDNLDALYDCLTDLSWHPASGYVITISGAQLLSSNPTSFATLNEVLACVVEEWETRNTPFRIFYLMDHPTTGKRDAVSSTP